MNQIISLLMFALAVCCNIFLVYMIRYTLGFREKNLIHVSGFLDKTELKKNVFRGHPFSGKWHKYWTNYTYLYRVNGQQYCICGGISGQRKDVPQKVIVAVQRNAPKNAIIPQFKNAPSKHTLLLLSIGTVFFYVTAIGLWYI